MKNKLSREAIDWEKMFVNQTSDKVLVFGIYKECLQLYNKKTFSCPKWAKDQVIQQRRYMNC